MRENLTKYNKNMNNVDIITLNMLKKGEMIIC